MRNTLFMANIAKLNLRLCNEPIQNNINLNKIEFV